MTEYEFTIEELWEIRDIIEAIPRVEEYTIAQTILIKIGKQLEARPEEYQEYLSSIIPF